MWKPAFGKDEGLPCLPMHFDLAALPAYARALDDLLAPHFKAS